MIPLARWPLLGCILFCACQLSAAAVSGDEPGGGALVAAARELEMARLHERRYLKVDYPMAIRRLENEIRLARTELGMRARRIAEYERIAGTHAPQLFLVTLDEERLAALELELRLEVLDEEKLLFQQQHADQRKLLRLQIEAAHDRWDQLRRVTD
jgi:hypothetical protein